MAKKFRKPKIGYDRSEAFEHNKKRNASYLYSPGRNKVTLVERIIKTIIYIVLRMVIKPSKWRNPVKNYEVIDHAYKRIISSDMIFIPSSIAFYLIMAFMPVLSIIFFSYSIPGFGDWLKAKGAGPDDVGKIIGGFIPGAENIFNGLGKAVGSSGHIEFKSGAIIATTLSLLISFWISGGGFAKLVFTQSYLYEHKFVGGYWANKFKGMGMVLLMTFGLIIILLTNLVIKQALGATNLSALWQKVILYGILIIGIFAGLILGFMLLFKFSPRFKLKFREVLPGALIAGIPTALFISIFGPLSSMWSYGNYGVAAAIMYIGMASLFITNFVFVGLVTNVAFYKTFVRQHTIKKWTLSRK